jgi:hypothetical protein
VLQEPLTLDDLFIEPQDEVVTLITPRTPADMHDLTVLLQTHRDYFRSLLRQRGALLFRGFIPGTLAEFETVVSTGLAMWPWNAFNLKGLPGFLASWLREYAERLLGAGDQRRYLSRDTVLLGPVDTAVQGPHVEAGTSLRRPRYLALGCYEPATRLGETGLVDLARVYSDLPLEQQARYSRAWNRFRFTTARRITALDRLMLRMSPFQVTERADGRAELSLPPTPAVCTVPGSDLRCLQPWAFARNTSRAAHAAAVAAFPARGDIRCDATAEALDLNWSLCDEEGRTLPWTEAEQQDLFTRLYRRAYLLAWQKGDVAIIDNVRIGHWHMNGEQGERTLLQIQAQVFHADSHRPGKPAPVPGTAFA